VSHGNQDTVDKEPNLQNLLDVAQRIQKQVECLKEELGDKTVEAESGGGLVRCVANGRGEVLSVTIDPSLLATAGTEPDSRDKQKRILEDLVTGAVNVALDRARDMAQQEIVRATGGMPMPPGLWST
jgi:DNA-binding YbaB/EbfC family protein